MNKIKNKEEREFNEKLNSQVFTQHVCFFPSSCSFFYLVKSAQKLSNPPASNTQIQAVHPGWGRESEGRQT